ncbi:hypothetical protein NpPPO83_00011603 [Neofusicoccum parvum]|uniref:Uncharacterized protein n=1 Tax=Neofusicoccum parvum TaxID=310453 RepID=A0ACB5SFE8_9PEZI|nr:hypothetical protein NpPPO83_00011603 [Neofusicoccum parvum]
MPNPPNHPSLDPNAHSPIHRLRRLVVGPAASCPTAAAPAFPARSPRRPSAALVADGAGKGSGAGEGEGGLRGDYSDDSDEEGLYRPPTPADRPGPPPPPAGGQRTLVDRLHFADGHHLGAQNVDAPLGRLWRWMYGVEPPAAAARFRGGADPDHHHDGDGDNGVHPFPPPPPCSPATPSLRGGDCFGGDDYGQRVFRWDGKDWSEGNLRGGREVVGSRGFRSLGEGSRRGRVERLDWDCGFEGGDEDEERGCGHERDHSRSHGHDHGHDGHCGCEHDDEHGNDQEHQHDHGSGCGCGSDHGHDHENQDEPPRRFQPLRRVSRLARSLPRKRPGRQDAVHVDRAEWQRRWASSAAPKTASPTTTAAPHEIPSSPDPSPTSPSPDSWTAADKTRAQPPDPSPALREALRLLDAARLLLAGPPHHLHHPAVRAAPVPLAEQDGRACGVLRGGGGGGGSVDDDDGAREDRSSSPCGGEWVDVGAMLGAEVREFLCGCPAVRVEALWRDFLTWPEVRGRGGEEEARWRAVLGEFEGAGWVVEGGVLREGGDWVTRGFLRGDGGDVDGSGSDAGSGDSGVRGNSGSDATLVGSDEDEEAAILCMKALGLLHDLWDLGQAPGLNWFWFEYLDSPVSRDEDGNVDIQFWWELTWILEQELGVEAAGPRGDDSSESSSRKDNDPEMEQQWSDQDRPRSGSGDRYAEQQMPDDGHQAELRELHYDAEHIPRLGNDFHETGDADEDMEDVPQWLILFLLEDQNSKDGIMGRLRGGAGEDGKVEVSETKELWKLAKYYAEYHAKHFRDSSYHDDGFQGQEGNQHGRQFEGSRKIEEGPGRM